MDAADALVLTDYPWIKRRKITVAEYHKMGEAGILTEDDRVELIEGEIIEMAPIGCEHAGNINRLARTLIMMVGSHAVVAVQNPVRLNNLTEPQPDFALLRPRADDYTSATPVPADVFLIIEVADSSLHYDREVKRRLYASSGIPAYWVINVNQRVIETFTAPVNGNYAAATHFGPGSEIELPGLPGCCIAVSALFA